MDLWIYAQTFTEGIGGTFKPVGILDTASSIIWTNRYRECGDFEIYIHVTPQAMALLQRDKLVVIPGREMVGIIEKIEITTDEENGDYMTVTGRSLSSVLDRRIVWAQTTLRGTAENGMRQLINSEYITPADQDRSYSCMRLADARGFTETLEAQYTGDNLLEVVTQICAANNYGFRVLLATDGWLEVDFYRGVDRSTSQYDNPPVVFSEDMDALTASTYTEDGKNFKNVGRVAGEGEGAARRCLTVESAAGDTRGLARRETFIDARDVSSNDGEITAAEYDALLKDRGHAGLSEAALVKSMTGTVVPHMTYIYGTDYNLGDKVTSRNKYGMQVDTYVLEVIETWDENGYTCIPTFG